MYWHEIYMYVYMYVYVCIEVRKISVLPSCTFSPLDYLSAFVGRGEQTHDELL